MGKYSDYKGVSMQKVFGRLMWTSKYKEDKSYHDTEREAAKNYDLLRIKRGKDPVNVLKRTGNKRKIK